MGRSDRQRVVSDARQAAPPLGPAGAATCMAAAGASRQRVTTRGCPGLRSYKAARPGWQAKREGTQCGRMGPPMVSPRMLMLSVLSTVGEREVG